MVGEFDSILSNVTSTLKRRRRRRVYSENRSFELSNEVGGENLL